MSATAYHAARAASFPALPGAGCSFTGECADARRSKAADVALDIEQGVDAFDRLQRDRRDHGCVVAASGVGCDVRQLQKRAFARAPSKRPA